MGFLNGHCVSHPISLLLPRETKSELLSVPYNIDFYKSPPLTATIYKHIISAHTLSVTIPMARPRMAILLLIVSSGNIFSQLLQLRIDPVNLRAIGKILKRQEMKEGKSWHLDEPSQEDVQIFQNQLMKKSWKNFLSVDPNILRRMTKRSLVHRILYDNSKMGKGHKRYQERVK